MVLFASDGNGSDRRHIDMQLGDGAIDTRSGLHFESISFVFNIARLHKEDVYFCLINQDQQPILGM